MKLKTEQEIGLTASEYADQGQKNKTQIAWVWFDVKEAFKKGYTQAQQDLISQASEGFEEYIDYMTSGGNYQVNRLDLHEQTWQAAKLSSAKKMQEKDEEIEKLKYYKEQWQSIAGKANLKNLVATAEKLEKENGELQIEVENLREFIVEHDMNESLQEWNSCN